MLLGSKKTNKANKGIGLPVFTYLHNLYLLIHSSVVCTVVISVGDGIAYSCVSQKGNACMMILIIRLGLTKLSMVVYR